MKIKQQKNIKAFLNEEFGEKRGNDLFNEQEAMLNELIKNTQNKSKNQMKTLIQTIKFYQKRKFQKTKYINICENI